MIAGALFLVVGPSGAGKDTLIAAARDMLAPDPRFVFPRREITRPAEAGGEDHVAIDAETFSARESAGCYALSWRAHGLCYGIPASVRDDLASGRRVVVNVSRAVVADALARFPDVRVVFVTAPDNLLRERLAHRSREAAHDQELRAARIGADLPQQARVTIIANTSTVERGAELLVDALQEPANMAR
jgi:ribose 1,5-bisphosphokinase